VKQEKGSYTSSRLVHFSEVGSPTSYCGVFIAGPYPHWALMGTRGDLKIHPMSIDGPIKCFAPFDNVNCPKGFLYFNGKEEMRICLFPSQLNYDCPWPTRKVRTY
jgi:cleavage and polyadenylation specificity factor subunit 1